MDGNDELSSDQCNVTRYKLDRSHKDNSSIQSHIVVIRSKQMNSFNTYNPHSAHNRICFPSLP